MATLADVRSQNWQLSANALGQIVQGVDDVRQCIDVILLTQKGTRVFEPNFGVDLLSYLSRPATVAAELAREIQEQVNTYEPRARITQIRSEVTANGQVTFYITWQMGSFTGQNTVTYATAA